jgi:Adenylate and Guanylate cyclase catalytic domain
MGEGDQTRSDHAHQLESFEFAPYARHDNDKEIPHPSEFIYGWQGQQQQQQGQAQEDQEDSSTTSTVAPSSSGSVIETVGGRQRRRANGSQRRHMEEGPGSTSMVVGSGSSPEYVAQFGGSYDELFQNKPHVSHCAYVIELHPTVWFEIHYESDRPRDYALFVVGIFGIILLFLLAFDIMVVRRQRKLMATARRTHAVVASLFPETVQKRILEDAAKKDELAVNNSRQNHHDVTAPIAIVKGSGHGTNQTVGSGGGSGGGEFVYGSAPIADFFQSTTILFADLSGFTAWSSTKEPTQVFQLLEKIYCTFDELAQSRGVFKVRTTNEQLLNTERKPVRI